MEENNIEGGMVALIVLVIILIFLVVFICLIPYFREFSRRSKYWEDPANDPRWNKDQFQFSPKLGRHGQTSYEKLNTSSINTSLASGLASSSRNISGLPRDPEQVTVEIPTKFVENC